MKTKLFLAASTAIALLAGCASTPPGVERGPHGTIAYDVYVEASEPGARIEANGSMLGITPLHLKIFGNKNGTFHDFGSYYYILRAYPLTTNQYQQIRVFWTGRHDTHRDMIPQTVYFDMNQNVPVVLPSDPEPAPTYYYYGAPYPYDPYPYYYGPSVRFYFGPRWEGHWHH